LSAHALGAKKNSLPRLGELFSDKTLRLVQAAEYSQRYTVLGFPLIASVNY
jgi:hypothetical protein